VICSQLIKDLNFMPATYRVPSHAQIFTEELCELDTVAITLNSSEVMRLSPFDVPDLNQHFPI